MRIKNYGRVLAALVTFSCLAAVVWMACTKPKANPYTCIGVLCYNGGYCHIDTLTKTPICTCPTGYEGPACDTASLTRYIGTWNMMQIITGSDSNTVGHDTSYYQVSLTQTATPTTFFINNFVNNPYYSEITCTLDSTSAFNFMVDTISTEALGFAHYQLLYGSGTLSANDSFITINLASKHLTPSTNWVYDTMTFILTHP